MSCVTAQMPVPSQWRSWWALPVGSLVSGIHESGVFGRPGPACLRGFDGGSLTSDLPLKAWADLRGERVRLALASTRPSVQAGGIRGAEGVSTVRAQVGDRITVRGHLAVLPDRECEVVEVRKPDGEPPYLVRWAGSGRQSVFFPGPDAGIGNEKRQGSERMVPFAWPDRYWWGYC